MANRISKMTSTIKDYQSKQIMTSSYVGEVVSIDSELGHFYYRFYNQEGDVMGVSIDSSKPKVKIIEQLVNTIVHLELSIDSPEKCVLELDKEHSMEFKTKTFELRIGDNRIYLDYDLYLNQDINLNNPISRNTIEIVWEGEGIC